MDRVLTDEELNDLGINIPPKNQGKKPKGCGKQYDFLICGEDGFLCKSCKPKNHNPSGKLETGAPEPEGTHSPEDKTFINKTQHIEGNFNLSDELEKWFNKWHRKKVTGRCLIELKNRDKKFNRRLKEIDNRKYPNTNIHELFFHCEKCKLNFYKEIDKLAGASLSK